MIYSDEIAEAVREQLRREARRDRWEWRVAEIANHLVAAGIAGAVFGLVLWLMSSRLVCR